MSSIQSSCLADIQPQGRCRLEGSINRGKTVSVLVVRSPDRKSYTLCSRMSLQDTHAERLLRRGKMGDLRTVGAGWRGPSTGALILTDTQGPFLFGRLSNGFLSPPSPYVHSLYLHCGYASCQHPRDRHRSAPCPAPGSAASSAALILPMTRVITAVFFCRFPRIFHVHSLHGADPRCQALADVSHVHYLESFKPFCKDSIILPTLH